MIQLGTTLSVYTGDDYHYEVTVNPDSELVVAYVEDGGVGQTEITFASKDEMRAVAKAMLRACDL